MLVIRVEQIEALKQTDEEFIEWIFLQLKQEHGEVIGDLADEKVKLLIKCGLQRAGAYKFEQRQILASFVMTMFVCAPNFDEYPPIQKILTAEEIREDQKFQELTESTTEDDWLAAREGYDTKAWFSYPRNIVVDELNQEKTG